MARRAARSPARARRQGQPDDRRGLARGGLPRRMRQPVKEITKAMSSIETSQVSALIGGLADGSVEIVGLTQPLSESTPVIHLPPPFANAPGLTREEISRYDDRGPA